MGSTLFEKVTVVPLAFCVLGRTLLSVFTIPFRGKDDAPTASEHVVATGFRYLLTYMSIAQLQMILPPWVSVYEAERKAKNLVPDVVDIPNTNVKGFWLGSKKTATYTMVWYHSGGFAMPGTAQLLDLLNRMIQWSNGNLAIFCVAYTLTPKGRYPLQIAEAVEGLRYVLSLPDQSPQHLLIGGDSAGGNLVLAVISHISGHPHPQSNLVKPLSVSGNLYGAIALAPWASAQVEKFASMRLYDQRDIITPSAGTYWMNEYKGSKDVRNDEYIMPELAAPEWWSGAKVSSFLALTGEHEILRDCIISWAQHFQEGAGNVDFKLVVGKAEAHVAPQNPKPEKVLIGNEEVYQEAAIRHWIKSRLA